MKYQFQKEDHNRQDKTRKPDYLTELRERPATQGAWSGVDPRKVMLRKQECRRVQRCFFVYGEWLYQHTKTLGYFRQLNPRHAACAESEMQAAFDQCRGRWQSDYRRICDVIMTAPVRQQTIECSGSVVVLTGQYVVHRKAPSGLLCDEFSTMVPGRVRSPSDAKRT